MKKTQLKKWDRILYLIIDVLRKIIQFYTSVRSKSIDLLSEKTNQRKLVWYLLICVVVVCSLLQKTWWLLSQAARGTTVSLSTSLSLVVFFLQFLDWWYSTENQSTMKTLTSLPAPPPPLHLQESQQGAGSRTCPLCHKSWTNTTVLSTSGFVFCYRCVYMYVKANRCCPLTRFPSELHHLIKIYAPES